MSGKIEQKKMLMDNYKAKLIPMDTIMADPNFNCRGRIAPIDVADLATDIKDNGLQMPIMIQPFSVESNPNIKWRIIAGHRRFMACRCLNKHSIPATIREDLSEIDALALNLTENTNRNPLTFYEEAKALEKFMLLGMSESKICKKIAKTKGWVQVRLIVNKLPEHIQNEVKANNLTQANVRDVYQLRDEPESQNEFVRNIKDGKKTRNYIRKSAKKTVKRTRNRSEIQMLQELVYKHFGNGVTTRALAWASGIISDEECLQTIKETCEKMGRPYFAPQDDIIGK